MIVQHIMRVDGSGKVTGRSISACSMDAIPVGSPGILPASVQSLEQEPFDPRDWVSFYPLNFLVTGVTFRDSLDPSDRATRGAHDAHDAREQAPIEGAPRAAEQRHRAIAERIVPSLSKAPFVYTATDSLARYVTDAYEAAKMAVNRAITGQQAVPKRAPSKRHYFELDTASAGWAVLNITANIHAWSLGDEIASVRGNRRQHIVRYASGAYTRKWQFWIDVPRDDSSVEVDLFVKHFDSLEPHVAAMISEFGEHVSAVGLTVWQRHYKFA